MAFADFKYGLLCAALFFGLSFANTAQAFEKPTKTDKMRTQTPMSDMTEYFEKIPFRVSGMLADRIMTYFWYAPEEPHSMESKYPLVVVLHGTPGNGYAAEHLISSAVSKQYPAFVMVPALPRGTLWANPKKRVQRENTQLSNVVKMIEAVAEKYPVDKNRIYVIGCSEGGFGAFGAALYYPEVFAAAVPISGGWRADDAKDMTGIPIYVIHGARDENVPISLSRDVSRLIHKFGGDINYNEYATMEHECPSPAIYSNAVWEWMFAQHKTAAAAE